VARPEPEHVLHPASAAELRAWLEANHETASEAWIGLRHRSVDPTRPLWTDLVDELLCFGWIDSIVHSVADGRVIRVTPRRAGSIWSPRNLTRLAELRAEGRLTAAGEAAASARLVAPGYGADGHWRLDAASESRLRADPAVWECLQAQPASFREQVAYWVMSAKRPETRSRRLAEAEAALRAGRRPAGLGGAPPNAPRTGSMADAPVPGLASDGGKS
jgi:uncharacterized protein YdeI (YjbR/CyaY-like superfamily)